ncbi:MAG: hypothetical protein DRH76_07370, partial [Deltaproteobacteria bacterium]
MALRDTALNIVIRLKDLTKGALKKFRGEVNKTGQDAKKAASGGLKKLALAIGGVVTAAAGFALVKRGITSVLTAGDKFEKLGIQMEAVMGSIESGEQATAWIKEFTKNAPLQLEDTTQAFLRLKNFGLDPMDGTLQAVVDQNEKLGGGQERLTGIANALGQAWAKQKLQGEEVLQLVERGVPVYDLLAKVTGKNGAALADMQKNGELTRDVIAAMIKEMGNAASGAAAANMSTLSGIVSNLKDRWTEWLGIVANSGVLDNFKNQLSQVGTRLKELADDGTLKVWAKQTSDGIISLFSGIKSLVTTIYDARGAIELFVKAWAGLKIAKLVTGVGGLARAFVSVLVPGVTASTTALKGLGTAMRGLLWVGLINAVLDTAAAFKTLREAKKALNDSLAAGGEVQDEATKRIQQFYEQTGMAANSLDDLIKVQDKGIAIFDHANNQWIVGQAAVAAYKASLDGAGEAMEEVASIADQELQAATKKVVSEFEEAAKSADKAGEAIAETLGNYELGALDDLRALTGGLQELLDAGKLTEDQLRDGLAKQLEGMTAGEIQAFTIALKGAFVEGTEAAETFRIFLESGVNAALEKLGVDLVELTTGISAVGTEALASFRQVTNSINESGLTAEQQSQAIAKAFSGAFAKIKTEAGRKDLLAGLKQSLVDGIITLADYNKAMDEVAGTTDAAANRFGLLGEEARRAGAAMAEAALKGTEMGEDIEAGASQGAGAAGLLSGAISGYTQQMAGLGPGAVDAFEQIALGVKPAAAEVDGLTSRMKALETELHDIETQGLKLQDQSGLQTYLRGLRQGAREVELAFVEQKIATRSLTEAWDEGSISAEQYIQKAERMVRNSDLLDD